MYKRIDADYYGYRDDEDGILEKLEQVAEKQMRAQAIEEWQQIEAVKNEARKGVKSGEVTLSPLLFLHTFLIAIEFILFCKHVL
jgi:pre-mRNA-splicing factor ISY1